MLCVCFERVIATIIVQPECLASHLKAVGIIYQPHPVKPDVFQLLFCGIEIPVYLL